MTGLETLSALLRDAEATDRAAQALAPALRPGDAVCLIGGLGAGKSAFARAVIQTRLAAEGRCEETPSPTYTLVQSYDAAAGALRHADLYRLSGPEEAQELGLFEPLEAAIWLIEWPERLGDALPERRLELAFEIAPVDGAAPERVGRRLDARFVGPSWRAAKAALSAALSAMSANDGAHEGDGA